MNLTIARHVLTIAMFTAVCVSGGGCGSAIRDEQRTQPLSVTDEKIATGQQVFMQHCYQCHPGGAGGLAPSINDKPLPVWLMKTQVRAGLGAMPGFSKERIDDDQLDALMAYLKSLRALKAEAQAEHLGDRQSPSS
jgi:mono/diheme cytochrome c family protein